ncbi:hypothetical protein E2C01_019816 [Portunus trituberculatus]|uniref:Uncharacterized protein n=1 Tax=Portunus trituberculatus TaxID=210409 RepID=A0A5B7DZW1_PORTR|nr:hypothetical protein [Portunus trituberculatus]
MPRERPAQLTSYRVWGGHGSTTILLAKPEDQAAARHESCSTYLVTALEQPIQRPDHSGAIPSHL